MDILLVLLIFIPSFIALFYQFYGLLNLISLLLSLGFILFIMQKILNKIGNSYLVHSNPTHLIVIQHGFLAPWIRATFLGKGLKEIASKQHRVNSQNRYLIHIIRSNSDDYLFGWIKTQDGIEKGGQRTCDEIKQILDEHPSIDELSLFGQSLGGLYMRYVIKQLYNFDKNIFYKDVIPLNFVTLGSPHLGIDDWFKRKNPSLYKLAQIIYNVLPLTILQLMRLDKQRIIDQMANDKEYLLPLMAFKNRMIYANAINDHRVSCSSGLILPSFGDENEESLMRDLFMKHIDDSEKEKVSIVAPISEENGGINVMEETESLIQTKRICDDEVWYAGLNGVEWKKFVVVMNSNFVDRNMAHGLLANPLPSYSSCLPILNHINEHFEW